LFALAKAKLYKMNELKEDAEISYLLAIIAEKEKDLDAMELNSQKATALMPSNCHYQYLFSKSLSLQGKHTQATIQHKKAKLCSTSKK
jgi:hypothetical protein